MRKLHWGIVVAIVVATLIVVAAAVLVPVLVIRTRVRAVPPQTPPQPAPPQPAPPQPAPPQPDPNRVLNIDLVQKISFPVWRGAAPTLNNCGNSCFFNAGTQLLYNTPPLRAAVPYLARLFAGMDAQPLHAIACDDALPTVDNARAGPGNTLRDLYTATQTWIQGPNPNLSAQQDPHEMIVHTGSVPWPWPSENPWLVRYAIVFKCAATEPYWVSSSAGAKEFMYELSLETSTLDSVQAFFDATTIFQSIDDPSSEKTPTKPTIQEGRCLDANGIATATIQSIYATVSSGSVILVQLKRFTSNGQGGKEEANHSTAKHLTAVQPSDPLLLPTFPGTTASEEGTHVTTVLSRRTNIQYNLAGVICHSGATMTTGHITYWHRFQDGWRQFDDSTVSPPSASLPANVLTDGYIYVYYRA